MMRKTEKGVTIGKLIDLICYFFGKPTDLCTSNCFTVRLGGALMV